MTDKFYTQVRITDEELYHYLTAKAKREGRSITKQLEYQLRQDKLREEHQTLPPVTIEGKMVS